MILILRTMFSLLQLNQIPIVDFVHVCDLGISHFEAPENSNSNMDIVSSFWCADDQKLEWLFDFDVFKFAYIDSNARKRKQDFVIYCEFFSIT